MKLTLVVLDKTLEGIELGSSCDVEAPGIDPADAIVLHIESFILIIIEDGE